MSELSFNDKGPDLEGCTDTRHCHRKRSARQEDAFTSEGRIKACHRPKGWGTNHPGAGGCKLHGGSAPGSVKAAQREVAQEAVRTLGLPVDVGPTEALLQELQRTAGHVVWLGNLIAGMESNDLVWGMAEEIVEPDIVGLDENVTITSQVTGKYRAAPSIWYQMYAQERKHLADVAKKALDAGVNERMVNMFEQVGDAFMSLFDRVLQRLDLTDDQKRRVPAAVVSELRAISKDAS